MKIIIGIAKLVLNIIYAPLKLLPVQKKLVILSRQSNKPSTDIDMLAAKVSELHPDYKVVVLCRKIEGGMASKLGYGLHILTQMYHLATSEIAVLDSYCIAASVLHHRKKLLIIQMWHSIGTMKQFGYSILDKAEGSSSTVAHAMKMHRNYDYVLGAGEGYRSHLAAGFDFPEDRIVILPLPRAELLSRPDWVDAKRDEILTAHPELKESFNVVYVPTFRKGEGCDEEFAEAVDALRNALAAEGDKYRLVVKAHPLSMVDCDYPEYSSFDMLTIADAIVSDYSCIIYEGAILGTPIYFYSYDFEEYMSARSMYMDYPAELPSPMFETAEPLANYIASGEYDCDALEKFLHKYVAAPCPNATEDIVNFIWSVRK